MKTTSKIAFIGIVTSTIALFLPTFVYGSTSGGSSIDSELVITDIITEITNFLTGPIALSLIILGLIIGAATIAIGRQNDSGGWNRLGKVIVSGTLVLGAFGLGTLFFGGTVI